MPGPPARRVRTLCEPATDGRKATRRASIGVMSLSVGEAPSGGVTPLQERL